MTVDAEPKGPYYIDSEHREPIEDLVRTGTTNIGRVVFLEELRGRVKTDIARDIYDNVESCRIQHPRRKSTKLMDDVTYKSVREGTKAAAKQAEEGGALTYAIRALGDEESWLQGGIHLEPSPESEDGTTGRMAYWMHEYGSSRGYATLAAIALIKYASSKLEIDTIELPIVKYKPAYKRVAEKVSTHIANDPTISVAITTFNLESV